MSKAIAAKSLLQQLTESLPKFSSTRVAQAIQEISQTVLTRGAAVITKHDHPSMVMLSIERYAELVQASQPNLGELTQRFDEMYARMQGPLMAKAMARAFAASPKELGEAAAKAGKRSR